MNDIRFKPTMRNMIYYQLCIGLVIMPVAMGVVVFFLSRSMNSPLTIISWKDSILFWLVLSLFGIVGAVLTRFFFGRKSLEAFSIIISDDNVSGPGFWIWQRNSIEIGKLDKVKSMHRSLYQRLFRLRNLWSIDGKKLEICEAIYGEEQIKLLLDNLQLKN